MNAKRSDAKNKRKQTQKTSGSDFIKTTLTKFILFLKVSSFNIFRIKTFIKISFKSQ